MHRLGAGHPLRELDRHTVRQEARPVVDLEGDRHSRLEERLGEGSLDLEEHPITPK